jgi:hypothetical protein
MPEMLLLPSPLLLFTFLLLLVLLLPASKVCGVWLMV